MLVNESTLLIDVNTDEYPLNLSAVRRRHPDVSFPSEIEEACLIEFGYAVVTDTVAPTGDVVIEGFPVYENGIYKRSWVVRNFNDQEMANQLDSRKKLLSQQILDVRQNDFDVGMPYTLGDKTFHVQLRDSDRANLLTLNLQSKSIIGDTTSTVTSLPFRTYENETVWLTPEQMVDMTNKALTQITAIYTDSWVVRDQVNAAASESEMPTIPTTFIV